jgi:hypothetical protein
VAGTGRDVSGVGCYHHGSCCCRGGGHAHARDGALGHDHDHDHDNGASGTRCVACYAMDAGVRRVLRVCAIVNPGLSEDGSFVGAEGLSQGC